jgi:hypothetical protein
VRFSWSTPKCSQRRLDPPNTCALVPWLTVANPVGAGALAAAYYAAHDDDYGSGDWTQPGDPTTATACYWGPGTGFFAFNMQPQNCPLTHLAGDYDCCSVTADEAFQECDSVFSVTLRVSCPSGGDCAGAGQSYGTGWTTSGAPVISAEGITTTRRFSFQVHSRLTPCTSQMYIRVAA